MTQNWSIIIVRKKDRLLEAEVVTQCKIQLSTRSQVTRRFRAVSDRSIDQSIDRSIDCTRQSNYFGRRIVVTSSISAINNVVLSIDQTR